MRFHIITLFPGAFDSYLGESIVARAIKEKKISISFYNPRDFVKKGERRGGDKNYAPVDGKPYGGGPGMVMEALPLLRAVEKAQKVIAQKQKVQKNKKAKGTVQKPKTAVIFFAPDGEKFTTPKAKEWAGKCTDLVLICGRYEGVDARVYKILKAEHISIGDYVLTGGELPAMVVIDCIARQIPGVLGNFDSREEERISSGETYTRPEVLEWKGKKHRVPKVLLSGNHKLIDEWRAGTRNNQD